MSMERSIAAAGLLLYSVNLVDELLSPERTAMNGSDFWTRLAPQPRVLPAGQKYHVFLSYRSVNRPWVLNLYDVLRSHGFEVFLDQVALKGGDQLIKKLEEGLAKSQAGVLVWSSAAVDSDWVAREYQTLERRASNTKAPFDFVPVRL